MKKLNRYDLRAIISDLIMEEVKPGARIKAFDKKKEAEAKAESDKATVDAMMAGLDFRTLKDQDDDAKEEEIEDIVYDSLEKVKVQRDSNKAKETVAAFMKGLPTYKIDDEESAETELSDALAKLKKIDPGAHKEILRGGSGGLEAGGEAAGGGGTPDKGEALAASKIKAVRVKGQKGFTYAEINDKWHYVRTEEYSGGDSKWKPLPSKDSIHLKTLKKLTKVVNWLQNLSSIEIIEIFLEEKEYS